MGYNSFTLSLVSPPRFAPVLSCGLISAFSGEVGIGGRGCCWVGDKQDVNKECGTFSNLNKVPLQSTKYKPNTVQSKNFIMKLY